MLELAEKGKGFPPALREGLAGYWRMEEAAWTGAADEVIDLSGNGNHGQSFNGADTIADGKLGRCGDFDASGSQYAEFPKEAFNHLEGTWAMWVKGTWSTQGAALRFFNITQPGGSNNQYLSHSFGGNFAWGVPNGSVRVFTYLGALTDDTWQHILFTWKYDGADTIIKGYLGGDLKDTKTLSGQASAATAPIQVMRYPGDSTTGMADELTLHDRELNSGAAEALYNSGAARLLPLYDSFALPLDVEDIRPQKEVVEV